MSFLQFTPNLRLHRQKERSSLRQALADHDRERRVEAIFPRVRVAYRSEIFDQLLTELDIVMKYPDVKSGLKDEVPWSDSVTAYDKEHFTTYMRFLDASADGDRKRGCVICDR
ncbi:MAG: hypothetical protein EOS73_14370 [Mesorhizobium sp.]|nr:hypothetical protein EN749_34710 [Mesorhizobium sp. M7A.F.Ca.ET.027.02.1.1]RWC26266.1 MAG: hypothetical protein EOS27_25570 [Mesorhizobium sp.]RWD08645.1 MAG: hypothetical protein EOS73_14370 [Mesorhizobium sp.]